MPLISVHLNEKTRMALIALSTIGSAEKAKNKLHGTEIEGQRVAVSKNSALTRRWSIFDF